MPCGRQSIPAKNEPIFVENLHVPTSGHTAVNESSSGAIGIPEFVPPIPNGYQTQSGQEADEP